MNMKRHLGRIINTDTKCVIVFMQIPGRDDHALVVSVDNLPQSLEEALMDIVESKEGQADSILGNVLGRRLYSDTGSSLMSVLHQSNLLRPVHIDQILMVPAPNMGVPLRQIIESMGSAPAIDDDIPMIDADKYNPHTANTNAKSAEERDALARSLLIQADLLQADADAKRKQAYAYLPELQPRTKKPVEVVEKVVVKPAAKAKAAPKKSAKG